MSERIKKKHPGGRPPKFSDKQIREVLIPKYTALCRQGFPDNAIAGELDVAHDYFVELEKRSPEFSDARRKAHSLREAFFYKLGLSGMTGKVEGFNATTFIWLSRNVCKWRNEERDVVETKVETVGDKVTYTTSWGGLAEPSDEA